MTDDIVSQTARPVRILVVATFLTRDQAGAAQSVVTIVRALAASAWAEVTVAAHAWDSDVLPQNVRLVRLPLESQPSPLWRIYPLTEYWYARRVLRNANLGEFDFCYTQSIAYGLAYRDEYPRVPIVSHPGSVLWDREIIEENSDPMRWRRVQAFIARRLERRMYAQANWMHIASSRLVANTRVSVFKLPADTFRVAPLPVDPNRFDPQRVTRDVRADLGIAADDFVVVVVARLVPWKRVDAVIRAIGQIARPLMLVVVGEGPERARLESLATELGVESRVRFVGRQDPPPFLAAADLFVLPSLIESLGLVYIEAMMMGLPCIGLAYRPPEVLSAASEVVTEGEVGFCVSDDAELRERIEQFAADPAMCRAMGDRGRSTALERFTPDRYVALLREAAFGFERAHP